MIVAKRRLSTLDHTPDVVGMTYVYPVVSRRAGGVSVGINLNPNNACNWHCAYCQVEGLVVGAGPSIDLERLETELTAMLDDVVHGDFLARSAPEGARVLKDVAFAGNGEPTTCPDFEGAVAVTGRVLARFGLTGQIPGAASDVGQIPAAASDVQSSSAIPVVLITNGSQVKKADVAAGIEHLARIGGRVWFKLDTATVEGMARVNRAPGDPATHLAKLRVAAALCPTWIQTCLLAWDGAPPSEAEQEAYLEAIRSLVRDAVPVRGVLLYSVARASKQPDAEHVAPLSDAWLRAFATRIEEAGLAVKVTA